MGTIKSIGILTSGGDAPGMNAAIRAVTRSAIYNGLKVYGIYRGYKGLVTDEIQEFKSQNVSNIIQMGGTILKTARCKEFTTPEGRAQAYENMKKHEIDALVIIGGDGEFKSQNVSNIIQMGGTILKTARCKEFTTPEGRAQAYENMKKHEIDALVIIGGDGSLTGARIFAQEFDVPCIGLPGTIDNDLYGTDTTIGYDTALNTILDAVDKIRDTATSHERLFFVEVMGRDAGFLALNGAIAAGAEAAIIPEFSTEVDQLEEFIEHGFRKSKSSSIVLVAESELTGGAMHYAERVKNEYPQYDVRVTILGHLQRGGRPTAHDRIIASRMGVASIQALLEGQRNVMIGIDDDKIVYVPFAKAIKNDKPIDRELVNVLHELSI
jgi:6-phosphofructokinase 1